MKVENQNELFNFVDLTVEKLNLIYDKQIQITLDLNDKISKLSNEELNYFNLFENPMCEESKYSLEFGLMDWDQLHPDKEIRDVSAELNKKLSKFGIEQSMRTDIYDKISYYYSNQYLDEKNNLNQEQIRYVEKVMIGYKMMGMHLDGEKQEKIKEITKELAILSSDYTKNLSDVNTIIEFEPNELDGMEQTDPEWINKRFDKSKGKCIIKLQYPDYIPIMEYCKVRQTRKIMMESMGSRCMDENMPIINKTIRLRQEKAKIFGFDSHSDYKLQNMMAKNSSTVMSFLLELLEKLKPLTRSDIKILSDLAFSMDSIEKIESWDSTYYARIYTENESGLKKSDLKSLFTIESVTNGIFSVYQELLGLKFIDITKLYPNALYSSDVKLFGVIDLNNLTNLTNPTESNNFIGYFYLDLFPREGKYGHAAMFTLIRKSLYNKPISAIVCNFDLNSDVDFDNVETYFHEFGHLMHNMVSTNNIASLSGTACQRDFVETPSQMFEEWCYCLEPFKRLTKPNMINMTDSVNLNIIAQLNKQNKLLQGLFNSRQISYGLLDMAIHSDNIPENTWNFYNNLISELFGWEISPKVNMLANWGHMYGYDSSYYGYLWSKVYAIDLFSFFKSDPMNKQMGKRLRDKILSRGGSVDGLELLEDFMERKPNPNAFIEWLNE